jgi:Na+/alanine symporter
MGMLNDAVGWVNGIVWGPLMLFSILGVGLFLTPGLKLLTIRRIPFGFSLLWKGRIPGDAEGQISPFNALMTSLSATIGTGNIAGVATAIALGGPGAIFWMWVTALVGMATKYAEAVCAVRFRETDENGNFVGGPMYYIQNGMGENWRWLALTFAFFAMIAGFGIGNMVQSQEVSAALTAFAFESALPGSGAKIIAISIAVFAFTTILGWSYYSERAAQYAFGSKIIMPFRLVWCSMVFVGAVIAGWDQIRTGAEFVWLLSDTLNAMMAIPNLIALAALSPIVFKLTQEFFDTRGKSEKNPF